MDKLNQPLDAGRLRSRGARAAVSILSRNGIFLGKCVRVIALFVFFYGVYMLLTYSVPMLRGSYESAAESYAADVSVSLYDAGLQRYRNEDYEGAVKALNNAYNATLGPEGVVEGDKRKLAADIKFLTGNALVNAGQLQAAVEAYKETLRLDPTNLYAKYNLEMLQAMNGGAGPGPDPSPGGQPGKGNKKGI
jgi:tetratricopeptide (TPR) repeat protein